VGSRDYPRKRKPRGSGERREITKEKEERELWGLRRSRKTK